VPLLQQQYAAVISENVDRADQGTHTSGRAYIVHHIINLPIKITCKYALPATSVTDEENSRICCGGVSIAKIIIILSEYSSDINFLTKYGHPEIVPQ